MNPAPALGALIFFLVTCVTGSARAATWTVTTNGDDSGQVACTANACPTLRDAITSAAAGDTISLSGLSNLITLGGTELTIGKNLTIAGPGANVLSISAGASPSVSKSRVLEITAGSVTLSGVTIRNGHGTGGQYDGADGGGILVDPLCTLNLNFCNVGGNVASSGGGIENYGTFTASDCAIAGNVAYANLSPGTGCGGGINNQGTCTLLNCTLYANAAAGFYFSVDRGGGGDVYAYGGAVYNAYDMTLVNCTVAGNVASTAICGGIFSDNLNPPYNTTPPPANTNLLNTAVTGNGDDVEGSFDGSGVVGNNIIGEEGDYIATGGFSAANHDQTGTSKNPILLSSVFQSANGVPDHGYNGGPTATILPLAGGLAVDAGNDVVTGAPYNLTTDERGPGYPRLVGKHVDIGAVEVEAPSPSVVSLTPVSLTSAAGNPESFTSIYADQAGYSGLSKVQICVGTNGYPSGSLYAEYLPGSNLLYLFNASNVAVGGFAPGSNNVITTPLGSLDCANTTVSGSGDSLTVTWSLDPGTSLVGNQSVYLQATDSSSSTAWARLGSWTIVQPVPGIVSLSPNALSSYENSENSFTATYSDTGGYASLTQVQFCVGNNGLPSSSLYGEYLPATNLLYLFNANNVAVGGFAPGSSNVITTTLGSLNCSRVTVTGSGTNLVVNWSVTPGKPLIGAKDIYLQAADPGSATNWLNLGTWNIVQPVPSVVSLTPASLISPPAAASGLTATYADGAGFASLTKVQLCVGANGSPATSLYAEYLPATKLLYLFNASNVATGGFAPGSNNVISTPLGSLNCATTTVTGNGNNLTVDWSITPTSSLLGSQRVYLQAADAGTTSVWAPLGTWVIASPKPATVSQNPATLSSLEGSPSSIAATYSDAAGAETLTQVQFCAGPVGPPSTSLYAEYLPATNLLYLFNASDVAVGGFAPGSANVITTTLGSLNCAQTTVSASGDDLTVNWSLTPAAALEGVKATYLQAADASSTTSWTKFGTWTISAPMPACVSVTPSSMTSVAGNPVGFTTTYSDGSGSSALTKVQICVGGLTPPATSLYAEYLPATNLLYLFNGSNVAVGGFAPGSANVITTPLGSLDCANTAISISAKDLSVGWSLTPSAALVGSQAVYLDATDSSHDSGWSDLGSWTIQGDEISGQVMLNGSGASGVTVNLTGPVTASAVTDANGDYAFPALGPGNYTVTPAAKTGIVYQVASQNEDLTIGPRQVLTANFVGGTPYTISGQVLSYANGGAASGVSGVTVSLASVPASGAPTPLTSVVTGSTGAYTFTVPLGTYAVSEALSGSPFLGQSPHDVTVPAQGNGGPDVVLNFPEYRISGSVLLGGSPASGVEINLNLAKTTISAGTDANGDYTFGLLDPAAGYTVSLGYNPEIDGTVTNPQEATVNLPTSGLSGVSPNGTVNFTGTKFTPPANDDFAEAQPIAGASGSVIGNTGYSTLETGEPNPPVTIYYGAPYGGDSVWYKYSAPSGSELGVSVTLSTQQIVNVYSGSALTSLKLVAHGISSAQGVVTPGDDYYFQVMDQVTTVDNEPSLPSPAQFTLRWSTYAAPANDDFANASVLSGTKGLVGGTLLGATVQASEPQSQVGATVWYTFTAPSGQAGNLSVTVPAAQAVAVYTGSALNNLTLVESWQAVGTVSTEPGTTYYLQVFTDSNPSNSYNFTLDWAWSPAPANDNRADAETLPGNSGSLSGTTFGATNESGEPDATGCSVWYLFPAQSTIGSMTVSLSNESLPQVINVYDTNSHPELTPIYNDQSGPGFNFETTPGVIYAFQVENDYQSGPGAFTLTWSWTASTPANDNFANATALTGNSGQVNGTNIGATLEPGEPTALIDTVWYQYTAPTTSNGIMSINLSGSFTGTCYVYTGSPVSSLTGGTTAPFATTPGTSYHIQVGDSALGKSGPFTLTWSWNPVASNDDFANAQVISGPSGSINGTTVGSTAEPGEPNATYGTVWYRYTAPTSSNGTLYLAGPSVNVYTGTAVNSLVQVEPSAYPKPGISFATTPGTVYSIQVPVFYSGGGYNFTLSWVWTAEPSNDTFPGAIPIGGLSGSVTGTTAGADQGAYLTDLGATYGVWYAFSTPGNATGQVDFTATSSGSGSPPSLGVFTGMSEGTLSAVASSTAGNLLFTPVPGTTYYLYVQNGPSLNNFTLSWSFPGVPANDNFANAQPLSGTSGSVNGSTVDSTIEPNDPNAGSANNSVWYAYTAPTSSAGSLTLTVTNAAGPDTVCVYTGSGLSNLSEVTGDYQTVTFATAPGATYYIEITSPNDDVAPFNLTWSWSANQTTSSAAVSSRGGSSGEVLALPVRKPSGHSA